MKSIQKAFKTASLLALFFSFSSCGGDQKSSESTSPVVEEIPDFALLDMHTDNRSKWESNFSTAVDSLEKITVVEQFYNIFDSTHVYVLLSVENAQSLQDVESYLHTAYPSKTLGSIMMNERAAVEMSSGAGDLYTFVTHRIKDFDVWYETFMAMQGVKNADSIYILGVFSELGDSLNVGVLSRAVNMGKAAAYGRNLEKNNMLKASGVVSEPDAIVLRRWDYGK